MKKEYNPICALNSAIYIIIDVFELQNAKYRSTTQARFIQIVLSLVFALSTLAIPSTSHSEVICTHETDILNITEIRIKGMISTADVEAVTKCLRSKSAKDPMVILDSSGGDIYPAMNVGRIVRKNRLSVGVFVDSKCLSSCVMVLAAGTIRFIKGDVGIHRPYSTNVGNVEYSDAQRKFNTLRKDVEEYFDEMNVSRSLFAAMVKIPPEEMHILSDDEMRDYGLAGIDPVEKEVQDAKMSQYYDLSKEEYLIRNKEGKITCEIPEDYEGDYAEAWEVKMECEEAIKWGLSKREYLSRKAKSTAQCSQNDDFHSCHRAIMRGKPY